MRPEGLVQAICSVSKAYLHINYKKYIEMYISSSSIKNIEYKQDSNLVLTCYTIMP